MSLDTKILRRAIARLEQRRMAREEEAGRRRAEIYRLIPRVAEIDGQLQAAVIDIVGAAMQTGRDPAPAIGVLRDTNLDLQAERAELLSGRGYPTDYLDEKPACLKCEDTGYVGSKVCSCLQELYNEEQKKELSYLLKIGEKSFDTFDFNFYDETVNYETGISPRENIWMIYDTCAEYARNFGKNSGNLFLNGKPGLGKTFLSACIAKEVSEQGFSVIYDTAVSIFEKFEAQKFFSNGDASVKSETQRFFNCDLLIVDDLATEMITAFVQSVLYTIINTRLMNGKKTVINSNLTMAEMRQRYSQQILSRLEGEYITLYFFGKDIRLLKKSTEANQF